MEKRGADGVIMPFKDKFPNGLKPLADYIHSKGLKFGVYSGGWGPRCLLGWGSYYSVRLRAVQLLYNACGHVPLTTLPDRDLWKASSITNTR